MSQEQQISIEWKVPAQMESHVREIEKVSTELMRRLDRTPFGRQVTRIDVYNPQNGLRPCVMVFPDNVESADPESEILDVYGQISDMQRQEGFHPLLWRFYDAPEGIDYRERSNFDGILTPDSLLVATVKKT